VESDEDSAPESISDTQNWHNWNHDLGNPNDHKDHPEAEVESDMELAMASRIRKAQRCGMSVPHQMFLD